MTQVTAAQMKQIEQAANAGGLSYLQMMENAGQAAAQLALKRCPAAQTAAVFCGKGNNGGDGFVVARLLHQAGLQVQVILTDGPPTGHAGRSDQFPAGLCTGHHHP